MAQDFPLSLQQLLPIMDVIGYANKYLKRVSLPLTAPSARNHDLPARTGLAVVAKEARLVRTCGMCMTVMFCRSASSCRSMGS